jgi:methylaspartate mutase sigma subunit
VVTGPRPTAVLAGTASDDRAWHLAHLHLALEALGYQVAALGPGVPDDLLVAECAARRPDLLVLGGSGPAARRDALRVIGPLREHPGLGATGRVFCSPTGAEVPDAELVTAGFDAVLPTDPARPSALRDGLRRLTPPHHDDRRSTR